MTALLTAFTLGTGGVGVVVTQTDIMNQFLDEKEGNRTTSYLDSANPPIWTICRGVTRIDDKPVTRGMRLTEAQCDVLNSKEAEASLKWVRDNVKVPLNPIQQVGIASFCPYNLGASRCRFNKNGTKTKFWSYLEQGNWQQACKHIPDWVFDGGKDCRVKANGCSGQPIRREQEEYLCLYTLGETS